MSIDPVYEIYDSMPNEQVEDLDATVEYPDVAEDQESQSQPQQKISNYVSPVLQKKLDEQEQAMIKQIFNQEKMKLMNQLADTKDVEEIGEILKKMKEMGIIGNSNQTQTQTHPEIEKLEKKMREIEIKYIYVFPGLTDENKIKFLTQQTLESIDKMVPEENKRIKLISESVQHNDDPGLNSINFVVTKEFVDTLSQFNDNLKKDQQNEYANKFKIGQETIIDANYLLSNKFVAKALITALGYAQTKVQTSRDYANIALYNIAATLINIRAKRHVMILQKTTDGHYSFLSEVFQFTRDKYKNKPIQPSAPQQVLYMQPTDQQPLTGTPKTVKLSQIFSNSQKNK